MAHAPSQGVTRETTRALLRLIVWLTVLAYILDLKPTLRLFSEIIWLGAFLWMYVYRIGQARSDPRSKYYYEELPLRLPRRLVPHTVALMVLVAASLPWSGAFFTGGCAKAGWFNNVWPTGEILASRSVFFIGTLSLLIGTATFPLVEEFTFRGWLLRSWTRKLGRNWAVLLTSALFAVAHFTFHAGFNFSPSPPHLALFPMSDLITTSRATQNAALSALNASNPKYLASLITAAPHLCG